MSPSVSTRLPNLERIRNGGLNSPGLLCLFGRPLWSPKFTWPFVFRRGDPWGHPNLHVPHTDDACKNAGRHKTCPYKTHNRWILGYEWVSLWGRPDSPGRNRLNFTMVLG